MADPMTWKYGYHIRNPYSSNFNDGKMYKSNKSIYN